MTDFLSNTDFELFRKLIYDESGIHFSATNRSILESRIKEQLREKNLSRVKDYYDIISRDKDELKNFLDSITTNLTRFFRNQSNFDTLEKYVLPELLKIKKTINDFKIKIWSAGCSTGEEPYSIAMLMKETLPISWKVEIVASDISLKSLMVANEGLYSENHIAGIPDAYLKKYFDHVDGGYRVHNDIKEMVRFDYHNLKNDSGLQGMDVVFCRNVLIYFDEAAQKATIERFWNSMAPKSFLFIGHSESLFGMNTKFEFVKTDWGTLYRKYI
jgi:chemotaxis protein methyltransferase CheR